MDRETAGRMDGRMTRDELAQLLDRLAPELDALAEPWCVIGSGALMIAGVDWPDCGDVDILTTTDGARALETAWAEARQPDYAPDSRGPFRSRFSRYDFRPGAVEVMGDLDVLRCDGWVRLDAGPAVAHAFAGRTWPAPALADQRRILELFGRPKDLEKAQRLAGA